MSQLPGALRALHRHERWSRDWYVEPAWCVHALFERVHFVGAIHDPACGGGTIPTVAGELGHEVTGSDLVDRGFGTGGVDFLTDLTPRFNIVSNPPYRQAEAFVRQALTVACGQVALILPISFSAGQCRKALFEEQPPRLELVLGKRPSMPPGGSGIPARGGTTDYSWFVWRSGHRGPWLKQVWYPQ